MDKNRVTFGLSNLHFAFIDPETINSGVPIYAKPAPVPGAVDWSPEAQTEEYKFYADNGIYYGTFSDNGYAGDLEVAKVPDEVLIEMLGWILDQITGGLLEVADGQKKNFALLAQVEGDIQSRRIVYYNCAGSKPTQTMHTTEDSVEVQTQKMSVTVSPIDLTVGGTKRKCTKYVIARDTSNPAAMTVYDNFFKSVFIPSLPEPVPVAGVALDKETATMTVGEEMQLAMTITPEDATNKSVAWVSSDQSVATISQSGLVTAASAGESTITVTTDDGGKTASCVVTVQEA